MIDLGALSSYINTVTPLVNGSYYRSGPHLHRDYNLK